MGLQEFGAKLERHFPYSVKVLDAPSLVIALDSVASLEGVRLFLRDHTACSFEQTVEIAAVDCLGENYADQRFKVVYCLLSRHYNARRRVVVPVSPLGTVPSLVNIFRGTGWLEREVYDRHGIFFLGNLDLRRLLTDYGFQGYPLRKDFPLTGFTECRYSEKEKRVILEGVELAQEFRSFDANSWRRSNATWRHFTWLDRWYDPFWYAARFVARLRFLRSSFFCCLF